MGREINRLTAKTVEAIKEYGRHADGGNLYLSVSPDGGRRWVFMYRWRGKQTEIGLGSARDVALAKARQRARKAREQLSEGVNPKEAKKPKATATFGECADQLIATMRSGWRNEKHTAQWEMTLREYAAPLRCLPVADITVDDVLKVLSPIWQEKPETASRVRGRIERVLDAAKAKGLRSGENPARWRGHLDQLLPKRQHLSRGHHKAMRYGDVPDFLGALREREGIASRALEFAILTAARTNEVLGARWQEIDSDRGLWTVPPARMKASREHRVPLSARALEIVRTMRELTDGLEWGDFVFPSSHRNKPLSNMALATVLRRMEISNATVHGFRSSFRDWAAECTNHSNETCEAALAHVIGNKAEAAYRRGDQIEKRRKLMGDWATFCGTLPDDKIVPFAQATG